MSFSFFYHRMSLNAGYKHMSSSVPFDTSKLATSDPQVLVALIKYYYRDCIQLFPEEILIRLYSSLGTLFILQKRQDLKCSIYLHLFTFLSRDSRGMFQGGCNPNVVASPSSK